MSHFPTVLWAQRSSTLFLTFEVWDLESPTLDIQPNTIQFSASSRSTGQHYSVSLDLFSSIVPDAVTKQSTDRALSLTLPKADPAAPHWPRLLRSSTKPHYVKTDFSKWMDEDEEHEREREDAGSNPLSSFGSGGPNMDWMRQLSAGGAGSDLSGFEGLEGLEEEEHDPENEEPLDAHIRELRQKEQEKESNPNPNPKSNSTTA